MQHHSSVHTVMVWLYGVCTLCCCILDVALLVLGWVFLVWLYATTRSLLQHAGQWHILPAADGFYCGKVCAAVFAALWCLTLSVWCGGFSVHQQCVSMYACLLLLDALRTGVRLWGGVLVSGVASGLNCACVGWFCLYPLTCAMGVH